MRLSLSSVLALVVFAGCEVTPSSPVTSRSTNEALWNEPKDRPQLLGGPLFDSKDDAETTARAFLASRAREFHLDGQGSSLTLSTTREGLSGTYLRFAQQQLVGKDTLPVFEGEVIVLVRDDGARRAVRAVNLEQKDEASSVVEHGDFGATQALSTALSVLEVPAAQSEPQATRGVYVTKAGAAHLAWRVKVATESPPHDWTLYLDAASGDELGRRDGVKYANGTAYVFDMNAVASTNDLTMVDGNNATTPALDAARFLVVMPNLDGSGNTRGSFADVHLKTAARVNSATNDFLFTRDAPGFKQANTYFHIDRNQSHIQALGFQNVNNRVQEAVVDAQTADNSFYSGNNLRLNFGTGGVDDAEDADIVTHEYGHSIQDNQVPGFGGGDEGAMGEGFGDYLAASFSLALAPDAGHPQLSDPACVGDWDGTSYSTTSPKCLRRVDGTKHNPEAADGEVHDDGEMWSSGLWDIRGQLGGDAMDKLVLEAHFLLGTSSSFSTATSALITADLNTNAGVNGVLIRRRMIQHGLTRLITPPATMGPVTSLPVSIGNNRDSTGNYVADTDETQTVSVPGATGLIVHFTRIELETNNQCLNNSCDNIYLTNGDGDLFQVVQGVQAAGATSVAVVGDTVHIRLVSDNSQQRFGYHVDRIDVIGAPPDAGVVLDGGIDVFDGGVIPPPFDGGMMRDAGIPRRDGGVFVDAGRPVIDSGIPVVDAGQPPVSDGGFTSSKTLTALGTEQLSPVISRGCGCGATTGLEAWVGLALLGLINRRRRTS